jgi:hypothetical protein
LAEGITLSRAQSLFVPIESPQLNRQIGRYSTFLEDASLVPFIRSRAFRRSFAEEHAGQKSGDEHKALNGGEETQWPVPKPAKR